jgi:RNA 2',3'-cyclic 3'-phosphodiesterase
MRALLAVPADPAWVERVSELTGLLKTELPPASWTRPEAWHLTLKFLGDISRAGAETFAAEVGRAAGAAQPGELLPGAGVVFPQRGRARVLGIGFALSPALATLEAIARAAEAAGRSIGAPPEERPFHPHVTLARLRHPWRAEAVERFLRAAGARELPPWRVRSCVLYESRLDPAGAVHTPLHTFVFSGAPAEARA